jgi:hypothetical protein
MDTPEPKIDRRFSDPEAGATAWADTARVLAEAELYWLTTMRADGRPHVTPLIGVVQDGVFHFCTGLREQKAHNLERRGDVVVTTGNNTWAEGLDVVVEGTAVRVVGRPALGVLADAYVTKYGEVWRFDVGDDGFGLREGLVAVFRVEPSKVMAFAKAPHGQTTYRFG